MAWRFKASKYKNATPKIPKKEESISGLSVNDVGTSCGNHIKSSCVYMAFNVSDLGGGGGSLGYLPLETKGRQQSSSIPNIHAHSELVTDFDFSPFDDYLLATGSQDNYVKLWLLPDETATTSLSEPVLSFANHGRRIGNVLWHPAADGLLSVTADNTLTLFDVGCGEAKSLFNYAGHQSDVQSVSWKGEGSLVATSCKDKKIRVIDPRANKVVQEGQGHNNPKDSRVLWLGDKDFLLSTGFSASRTKEVKVWDPRSLTSSLHSIEFGNSTGTIMPLFDPDTSMMFLISKAESTLNYFELTEKSPYLTQANVSYTDQIKGACLVPKRGLNLMDAEVNRLLLLCQDSITPAPYIVPRKNYREFHDDIFPDTRDGIPGTSANQWLKGNNNQPPKMRLQPDKTLVHKDRRGAVFTQTGAAESVPSTDDATAVSSEPSNDAPPSHQTKNESTVEKKTGDSPCLPPSHSKPEAPSKSPTVQSDSKPAIIPKFTKQFYRTRQSKYRYIQGKLEHPKCFTTNLRSVSKTIPGESDMFAINQKRCVVPLDGAGGCLQVLDFSQACRLPDTGTPYIQNGSKVTDFAWDPFDETRLAVALDSAKVNIWKIPEGGLTDPMEEPEFSLWGHQERIHFVSFHPLASDILATGSLDLTVKIWDLTQQKDVITLEGHEDQIFCFGWSQSGQLCATVCRDGKIRIFDPRKGTTAIKEGVGPEGQRGARVVWALKDKYLVVTGFDKSSRQQIRIYDTSKLEFLELIEMETSPAILTPHYDPDCSVVYLSSRGERVVKVVDVVDEEPYLIECAPFVVESLHQAVCFLPKTVCNVRDIEVAKGWRLTMKSLEALTFTVPRVKPQYFQDDLFPDTAIAGKPALSASDWLSGKDVAAATMSLRPADMQPLSEAPVEAPKPKKFESYNVDTFKTDEQKKDESGTLIWYSLSLLLQLLLSAMAGKLELSEEPLPQDLAEGVDDDEWDD